VPTVTALFRYPVKGFTPEALTALEIDADGRVRGDRVLAFRFADAVTPDSDGGLDHWPKERGLSLMRFASLARLRTTFDAAERRLRIHDNEEGLVLDTVLDDEGRREAADAIGGWLTRTADARLLRADGVMPLHLIGDGLTSRFQDRARGYVSLHGAASVHAVANAAPVTIDDRRFRSNIVIGDSDAWEELSWRGALRIGEMEFDIERPIGRCAAITVNPDTGVRDARLLGLLTKEFAQSEPTLGVLLLPRHGGGTIRVGDDVTPL
jgi:uncharacterized protein YcbX